MLLTCIWTSRSKHKLWGLVPLDTGNGYLACRDRYHLQMKAMKCHH